MLAVDKSKRKLTFMVTLPCYVAGVIPLMRDVHETIHCVEKQWLHRSSRWPSCQIHQSFIATVVSSKPNPALQIGGFGLMCTPQMRLVENFALIMLRKLVLLQDRFCWEILEGLSSHLGHGDISSGSEASIFEVRNLTAWCQFQFRVDQVTCQQLIAACL